ncbi:MAG: TonB family protein [Rhodothermales bacterium]
MILSNGSILNGRYTIQSVVGDVGPYDVNYLAWDLKTEREAVVREYYPLHLAKRSRDGANLEVSNPRLFEYGLGAYLAEGALLMEVNHPRVVSCTDQFKQNGTVYRVSDYVSGASLSAYIRQHQGRIAEEDALGVIRSVLGALDVCHARRLFHAGITPKSIYMTMSGQPVLLGFQAARFKLARRCETLAEAIHAGFSAPELSGNDAPDGPWWDVYGCSATLLYMLSGRVPPALAMASEAGRIQTALHRASGISNELRSVLEMGLAYHPADRPSSAAAFNALLGEVVETTSRRLRANASRPVLHVGVDLEEASSDAIWHSDVEIVATTPAAPAAPVEHMETTSPVRSAKQEGERPMQRESSEIVPTTPTYVASNGHERVSARASDAAPGREKELEQLVVKMVKWQQVFVGSILAVVFLAMIGVIGGVFFAPGISQRFLSQEPVPGPSAQAQAAVEPAPAAIAPIVAPALPAVDTLVEASAEAVPDEVIDLPEPPIAAVDREDEPARTEPARNEATRNESTRNEATRNESSPTRREPEPASDPAPEQTGSRPEPVEAPPPVRREELTSAAATPPEPEATPAPAQADSIPVPPQLTPEQLAAEIRNEQFNYYRAQGDSLIRLGFHAAALHLYQSAQRIKPMDTYVADQLARIEAKLKDDVRQQEIADSLKVRIGKVTDGEGYFVAPDTPIAVIGEADVRRNIKYPFAASSAGITGRVTVQYLVDANGRFVTARVLNGIGAGCDEEVVRALQGARFTPATFNGQAVTAWGRFSVVFGRR